MLYIAAQEQVLNNVLIMCTNIPMLAKRGTCTVTYVPPLVAMYVKYCMEGNFGGEKCWRIWRIVHDLPN